ncbi:MAG: hypothetical protein ACK5B4_06940 [Bacteroidota bacterium]
MKKLFLIPGILLCMAGRSQTLSPVEKKIIAAVNERLVYAEEILKESVNINSGTLNVAGVKKVGDLFAKEFEKAGMQPEWVSLPDSLRRAGHLVATRKGNKGKKLFLIGHLAPVFEPARPPNP